MSEAEAAAAVAKIMEDEEKLPARLELIGFEYMGRKYRAGATTWYASHPKYGPLNATSPEQLLRRAERAANESRPPVVISRGPIAAGPRSDTPAVPGVPAGTAVGISRRGNTSEVQPRKG